MPIPETSISACLQVFLYSFHTQELRHLGSVGEVRLSWQPASRIRNLCAGGLGTGPGTDSGIIVPADLSTSNKDSSSHTRCPSSKFLSFFPNMGLSSEFSKVDLDWRAPKQREMVQMMLSFYDSLYCQLSSSSGHHKSWKKQVGKGNFLLDISDYQFPYQCLAHKCI